MGEPCCSTRAAVEQGDAVRDRHGLDLIVSHQEGGQIERDDERSQPGARLLAQLRVEIGERLVEQDDGGFVDEGARERHALLLPAGELVRVAAGEMREPDLGQRMRDTCLDIGRAYTPQLEAVGDVLKNGAVRPQRIGLKHQAEPARFRGQLGAGRGVIEDVVADADGAAVRRLQAGDRAQQRGLAAARGPQQCDHLSRGHRDGDALEDFAVPIPQRDVGDRKLSHAGAPRAGRR